MSAGFVAKGVRVVGALIVGAALSATLAACSNIDRLKYAASVPEVSNPADPTKRPGYQQISMPMPDLQVAKRQANSLWRPGSRTFFEDLRAATVGDIVTVKIEISDNADLRNATTQKRASSEKAGLPQFFGLQTLIRDLFPTRAGDALNPASLVDITSSRDITGNGNISRREQINIKVAAVVTQMLPNGNMVIHGRQETRVNAEVRELQVAGVIRPQDIDIANQVAFDKIAEARVAYGGFGDISDVTRPRYGSNIVDIILPF